jgi:hypothetical protein
VIDAQRPCAGALRFVQSHEQTIRVLAKRIVLQQSFGMTNGFGAGAAFAQSYGQSLESFTELLAETIAVRHQPFRIETFEEIAFVQVDRLTKRVQINRSGSRVRTLQCVFELIKIDTPERLRFPVQRVCVKGDEAVDVGNRLFEFVKKMPEIGPCL